MDHWSQHSKQKAVFDDDECKKLVHTFSQFFLDKVIHIRGDISQAVLLSSRQAFTV